jgi:glycosyltransferase involved in cell wall biosynthesis
LKVLHIYKDYYPPIQGGIEKTINFLCTNFKSSIDTEVLVTNREFKTKIEIVDGIKVYKIGDLGRFLSAPFSPLFPYWIGKIKTDILHFHLPNPTAVISYLIRKPKGKVVVTWHSDIIRQRKFLIVYRPFLYRFLKHVDTIIGTSKRYIETSPHLTKFIDKCTAIPLGIDQSHFESNQTIDREVREIKKKYGNRIVLFVGLLRYYKGVQYLIESMKSVNGNLLIIGKGPMEANLTELTKNLKLDGKVFFLGEVDDHTKLAYLHACDVFCLPSIFRSEGFGLSQLEAFACGKPVVSTNLDTGVPYVNQNEITGIIVEPCNSNLLAYAINRLLDNQDLREKYGAAAKIRVQTEFSHTRILKLTREVYEKLVGKF